MALGHFTHEPDPVHRSRSCSLIYWSWLLFQLSLRITQLAIPLEKTKIKHHFTRDLYANVQSSDLLSATCEHIANSYNHVACQYRVLHFIKTRYSTSLKVGGGIVHSINSKSHIPHNHKHYFDTSTSLYWWCSKTGKQLASASSFMSARSHTPPHLFFQSS